MMTSRLALTFAAAFCLVGCEKEITQTAPSPGHGTPISATPTAAAAGQSGEFTTTASRLKYQVLKHGTGSVSPKATDTVKVHYHGTLLNGTVFDSSVQRRQPQPADSREQPAGV